MGAVLGAYLSANGVWYDQAALPSDFESGMNLKASLSPHISLVGAGDYGFQHSYIRGSGGVRLTVTDPADPNLSIGLGAQYHVCSKEEFRPKEMALDASLGYRPFPGEQPRMILAFQGSYGLQSHQASALAGIRYQIGGH